MRDDEGGDGERVCEGEGGVVVKRSGQKKTGPLPAAAAFTSPCLSDCPFPSDMMRCVVRWGWWWWFDLGVGGDDD